MIPVLPQQQSFTNRKPSSLTRRCTVRLSSIADDSLLLPPVAVWAVSQSQCGRSPSQVSYASLPWFAFIPPTSLYAAGPSVSDSKNTAFIIHPGGWMSYPVLAHVSVSYPDLTGRLPTCYSPVRRSFHRCTPRRVIICFPRSTCMY